MKKILALALTSILLLGGAGVSASAAAPVRAQADSGKIYLVPGTYSADGTKAENTVASGADKLDKAACDKINTENAYLCTLAEGEELPAPASTRTDKQGNPYAFNGWWSIVDATVTYFEKVPAASETMFLYADWRADLSQRKDPVAPDEGDVVLPKHYMSIKRAATEKIHCLILGFLYCFYVPF